MTEARGMMNWKYRTGRQVLFALLGGVIASGVYFGLEFTKSLHGFAVMALGPAIELVWHHLDPDCYTRSYCSFEVLAANAVLYACWIFVVVLGVDLLRHLQRKWTR